MLKTLGVKLSPEDVKGVFKAADLNGHSASLGIVANLSSEGVRVESGIILKQMYSTIGRRTMIS